MLLGISFIQCEALASKVISNDLIAVLKEEVKVFNITKGSSLNSQLFEVLFFEVGASHAHVLFHTDVCWLSSGRALTWVYNHTETIHIFQEQKW